METTSGIAAPGHLDPAAPLPPADLVFEDGIPMESPWHRSQMNLLIDLTHQHFRSLGRTDYYAGGNMFLYFSTEQVKNCKYRGPDFLTVLDVDGRRTREGWVVWEEDGRYPDLILELLSPTTRQDDLGSKKELYEQTFQAPEYFCFAPDGELLGWRLARGRRYRSIAAEERGWMWSETLQAFLGRWQGQFQKISTRSGCASTMPAAGSSRCLPRPSVSAPRPPSSAPCRNPSSVRPPSKGHCLPKSGCASSRRSCSGCGAEARAEGAAVRA